MRASSVGCVLPCGVSRLAGLVLNVATSFTPVSTRKSGRRERRRLGLCRGSYSFPLCIAKSRYVVTSTKFRAAVFAGKLTSRNANLQRHVEARFPVLHNRCLLVAFDSEFFLGQPLAGPFLDELKETRHQTSRKRPLDDL